MTAFTVARLINQSMPINYFMKTANLLHLKMKIILMMKDVMQSVRHRDFLLFLINMVSISACSQEIC